MLIAFLAPKVAPDYVSCTTGPEVQHFHAYVFVQLGDEQELASKFIRVSDSMGLKPNCAWPIHVHEGSGARGPYFALIHIESTFPISAHAYTLGDFFESWGEWLDGSTLYFGPDGVSYLPANTPYYRGITEVFTAKDPRIMMDTNGPWNSSYGWVSQPADRGIVLQDQVFYRIVVHGTFSVAS